MIRTRTLTSMSRTGPATGRPAPYDAVHWLIIGTWRASCLTLCSALSGCYFFLPFIEDTQNVPPVIDVSSPAEGGDLVFQGEQYTAFVIALDDDGDTLSFVWTIEGHGIQANAEPFQSSGLQGSQLQLQRQADYDGRTLSVNVYDPSGESARRSWIIDTQGVSE